MNIKTLAQSSKQKKDIRESHNPVKQKLWIGGYFLLGAGCILFIFFIALKNI